LKDRINKLLNRIDKRFYYLSSAYCNLDEAIKYLNIPISEAIEIGTFNGFSTAILTQYARKVFTFDVCQRNEEFIWNELRVRDKIHAFVSTNEMIEWEINFFFKSDWKQHKVDCNFNFAFIDGSHDYDMVKRDFELVKFCKKVLFHDYNIAPDVNKFCKEIGAKQLPILSYAYWEEN
jgi:hypothetical protein